MVILFDFCKIHMSDYSRRGLVMSRLHCPHCGTASQDVTEKDPCWKCGKILGEPVSEENPPHLPPPKPSPYLLQREEKPPAKRSFPIGLAVTMAVVILTILFVLLRKH